MTILSLLKDDHQKIKSLIKSLKTARKKSEHLKALHDLVHAHSKAEEANLYDRLKDVEKGRPLAFEGYEEHHVVAHLLKELENMTTHDDKWDAKVTVLEELLHHHIEEEEGDIFPIARKHFTGTELERYGNAFLIEKRAYLQIEQLTKAEVSRMPSLMKLKTDVTNHLASTSGKVGYFIAWLLGVPASLLLVIYLIRG